MLGSIFEMQETAICKLKCYETFEIYSFNFPKSFKNFFDMV